MTKHDDFKKWTEDHAIVSYLLNLDIIIKPFNSIFSFLATMLIIITSVIVMLGLKHESRPDHANSSDSTSKEQPAEEMDPKEEFFEKMSGMR